MALGIGVRWLRQGGLFAAGAACLVTTFGTVAHARVASSDTGSPQRSKGSRNIAAQRSLTPWEQAERGREELEAIPEPQRTRAQYDRAMDGYRTIYHETPGDVHAAAAVYAVAELLAEAGRSLHDTKSLKAAVGQYEFLRTQYPGSSLRMEALLEEGQIEQNDLSDAAAAKAKYAELLKHYPRSSQAEEARAGLASLDPATTTPRQTVTLPAPETKAATIPPHENTAIAAAASGAVHPPAVQNSIRDTVSAAPSSLPAMPQTSGSAVTSSAPKMTGAAAIAVTQRPGATELAAMDAETRPEASDVSAAKHVGKKAVVTGIRHWSTATYTRVAIDLGDNVTYEAARVPGPDRIYFDLHGTRLAQELVGKSFSVTDDGFLKTIRAAQFSDDMTRVVLDVNDVTDYSAFLLPNPYRLIIDIHGRQGAPSGPVVTSTEVPAPHAAGVVAATTAKPVPNTVSTRTTGTTSDVAVLSAMPGKVEATSKPTSKPISAVVNQGSTNAAAAAPAPVGSTDDSVVVADASASAAAKARKGAKSSSAAAVPARAAVPTADGETSLVRALGLKIGRIVIDAGHGGHDSGTLGADGIQEKDVVLDVALRVGKLLHERLGAEIIYTRSDDTFIPLETRTAIANKAQADLFLSIHANSSSDPAARGVETYYLNFTSDPSALETAARENAVSDQSIHQLSDLVKKIALKDKIEESREFASDVEGSLFAGLARGNDGLKDRGVKKAPFVVLIGANMPSILAEISFVTNPRDAEQLRSPEYRQRVAESLYRGVARYEGGLSGVKVPSERAAVGQ